MPDLRPAFKLHPKPKLKGDLILQHYLTLV